VGIVWSDFVAQEDHAAVVVIGALRAVERGAKRAPTIPTQDRAHFAGVLAVTPHGHACRILRLAVFLNLHELMMLLADDIAPHLVSA
jgi:hypothetical protein